MNIIDSHLFHALAFSEEVKLTFTEEGYLSFEEVHAFLFPSVAHYRLVNQASSICSNTSCSERLILTLSINIYMYIYIYIYISIDRTTTLKRL